MFLGRTDEQERFRVLLAHLTSQELIDGPSNALLVQGLGGMGKTWLLDRYALLARAEETTSIEDLATVAVDWEAEHARTNAYPASTGPSLVIALSAIQAAIAATVGVDRRAWKRANDAFAPFFAVVKQLPEVEARANRSFETAEPLDATQRAITTTADALASLAALTPAGPAAVPALRASGGLAGAVSGIAQRRRRQRGEDLALGVTLRPEEEMIRTFADGLRTISQQRRIVLMLDTCELVKNCSGWLRQAILQTGSGVLWVLAGRLEPEESAGSASEAAAFYRELPEQHLRVVTLTRFNDVIVGQALGHALGDQSRADALAADVATLTRGVPLAVGLVAGILAGGGDFREAAASVDDAGNASDLVQELAKRYLVHATKDPVLRNDIPYLYGLALLRGDRSDPGLLRALWGVDGELTVVLDDLAQRHDFVLSGSRRLHQEVRDAFRRYLLDTFRRDEMMLANRRAAEVALERAQALALDSAELRFGDDRWRTAVAAHVWHRFWERDEAGLDVLVELFSGAALLQSSLAHELVGIASSFYETFTEAERSLLRGLASMLSFGGFLDGWLDRRRTGLLINSSLGPFSVTRDEATDDDRATAIARLEAVGNGSGSGLGGIDPGYRALLLAKAQAESSPADALRSLEEADRVSVAFGAHTREQLGRIAREIRHNAIARDTESEPAVQRRRVAASRIAVRHLPDDPAVAFGLGRDLEVSGQLEEALDVYGALVESFGASSDLDARELVAMGLNQSGNVLGMLGRDKEAGETCAEIVRRAGDATELELQRQVAIALLNHGIGLAELGRSEESLAAYAAVVDRFGGAGDLWLQRRVAKALVNQGVRLALMQRPDEAMASYAEVIRRFDTSADPELQQQVAMALGNRGLTLGSGADSVAAYSEVIRRYGDATEPVIEEQVAMALLHQGAALSYLGRDEDSAAAYAEYLRRAEGGSAVGSQSGISRALFGQAYAWGRMGRNEESRAAYAAIAQRFGSASALDLQVTVARSLFNLGVVSSGEERDEAYAEVVTRFGHTDHPELRRQVALALVGRGMSLSSLGRGDEAVAVFSEVVARFGDNAKLGLQVAQALMGRGLACDNLGRRNEALAAYGDLVARFGDHDDGDLQYHVAMALVNTGAALSGVERRDDALVAFGEVLSRFGGSDDERLRRQVAMAQARRAEALGSLGRGDEAVVVYGELVARFGESDDATLRQHVATAQVNRAYRLWLLGRDDDAVAVTDEFLTEFDATEGEDIAASVAIASENRGQFMVRSNRIDDAIIDLEHAIRLKPTASTEAYVYRMAIASHRRDEATVRSLLPAATDAAFATSNCSPFRSEELKALVACFNGENGEAEAQLRSNVDTRGDDDRYDAALYRLLSDPPIVGAERIGALVESVVGSTEGTRS